MDMLGAFGALPSVDAFLDAVDNGLISEALANAQAVYEGNNENDFWSLAETNVGQLSFYVQDEWDVNDDLKLSFGLRADKPLYFNSADKAQDVIDGTGDYAPNTPYQNPNTGGLELQLNTQMPTDDWVWSPRFGFNYDVNGDSSLQMRGGTGLKLEDFHLCGLGTKLEIRTGGFHQMVDIDYKYPQGVGEAVFVTKNGKWTNFDGDVYPKDVYGLSFKTGV